MEAVTAKRGGPLRAARGDQEKVARTIGQTAPRMLREGQAAVATPEPTVKGQAGKA